MAIASNKPPSNRLFQVDLLKLVLAFLVVHLHVESFITHAPYSPLYFLGTYAVPIFATLTFYFGAKYYLNFDSKSKFLSIRLHRLLLPFLAWSLVGFLANPQLISLKYLLRQLAMGTSVDAPLYYLLVIAWLSIIFYLLAHLFRAQFLSICGLLVVLLLGYESFGINRIVSGLLPIQLEFFVSRFLEITKYGYLGIILYHYTPWLKTKLSTYWNSSAFILTLAVILHVIWQWLYVTNGHDYSGLAQFGIVALASSLLLTCTSIASSGRFGQFLGQLCKYSLGVYCLHNFFIDLLSGYPVFSAYPAILLSSIIFLVCLLICYLIDTFSKGKLSNIIA